MSRSTYSTPILGDFARISASQFSLLQKRGTKFQNPALSQLLVVARVVKSLCSKPYSSMGWCEGLDEPRVLIGPGNFIVISFNSKYASDFLFRL